MSARTRDRLVLAALLALAAVPRIIEAHRSPLSFDEIYVVMAAHRPLPQVLDVVRRDIHPPVSFALMWAWTALGGIAQAWIKALPILLSLLSLAVTWKLARRVFGPGAGWLALVLVAILPAHVHFSQEVGSYTPVWLFVLLTVERAFAFADTRRWRDAVLYALAALVAVHTEYVAAEVVAVLAVGVAFLVGRDRAALRRWGAVHLGLALACVPQARVFLEQFRREGSGAYLRFPPPHLVFEVARESAYQASYLVPVLVALAVLPFARRRRRGRVALLWALLGLVLVASRLWVVIYPRDALFLTPIALTLVAAGVLALRPPIVRIAAMVVLVGLGLRALALHGPIPEVEGLRRAAAVLRAEAAPGDEVVHAETHSLFYFRYHDPHGDHRLLLPAGRHVPFYDAGLLVEDGWTVSPERWARERARTARWWAIRVDRALATRGVAYRAGLVGLGAIEAAGPDTAWRFGPVTLWRGSGRRSAPPAPPGDGGKPPSGIAGSDR